VEFLPISRDHDQGAVTSSLVTEVYITLGEYDLALPQIDELVNNPTYVTVNWAKTDPLFDPLRNDERFQQSLERGALNKGDVQSSRRATSGLSPPPEPERE
jgi:hypothetical protein